MFITFEGGEGTGKSHQIQEVRDHLLKIGKRVVVMREPGSTNLSEVIRKIIFDYPALDLRSEFLLFATARRENFIQNIEPYLHDHYVLCDRFIDSSMVYQGMFGGVDLDFIAKVNDVVTNYTKPDLTFILDADPKVTSERIKKSNRETNRFDLQDLFYHEEIRNEYLTLAKQEDRFRVINAERDINAITQDIIRFIPV